MALILQKTFLGVSLMYLNCFFYLSSAYEEVQHLWCLQELPFQLKILLKLVGFVAIRFFLTWIYSRWNFYYWILSCYHSVIKYLGHPIKHLEFFSYQVLLAHSFICLIPIRQQAEDEVQLVVEELNQILQVIISFPQQLISSFILVGLKMLEILEYMLQLEECEEVLVCLVHVVN